MSKWEVWYYFDVWGNDADGYQVNDKTRLGTIELDEDRITLDYVLEKLGTWFDPDKLRENHPGFSGVGDDVVVGIDLEDAPFVALFKVEDSNEKGKEGKEGIDRA